MKSHYLLFTLLFCSCFVFGQKQTKSMLINKEEYKYLENSGKLIPEAIKHAFGAPNKQNLYTLEIESVDAWTASMPEFKYYPLAQGETRKAGLMGVTMQNRTNSEIKYRVMLSPAQSQLNDGIRKFLDAKNAFTLAIIITGDSKVQVAEPKSKSEFMEILNDQTFADFSFKMFYGDNPKKMNYNIVFNKLNACLVKDILKNECTEQFNLTKGAPGYDKFYQKATSEEYSGAYILFDLPIQRDRSFLTPAIEETISKESDGLEHIRFYFCIPQDNVLPKKKKTQTIEGKMLSALKIPLNGLLVYLRDGMNSVVATQKTDKQGYFKFEKLEEGGNYSLFIDNNCKEKLVYLSTKKNEVLGEFKKTDIGFEYNLIQADITKLIALNETDPSDEFTTSLKGRMVSVTNKISPIKEQVVQLKGSDNKILQSKKTDIHGDFEFQNIDPNSGYTIELPNYTSVSKDEKVYLANSKNELVQQFAKDASGKFSYKLIPAEICRLTGVTESDPELSFIKQKKVSDKEIIIRDFVYYNLNSFQLSPDSKPTLDKIANIITSNTGYKLEIISHTDSRGDKTENLKLSEKRSESVVSYLITKKVDPLRLKPLGMGEAKPLNACIDGAGCIEDEYKMNRRTEFRFYK